MGGGRWEAALGRGRGEVDGGQDGARANTVLYLVNDQ